MSASYEHAAAYALERLENELSPNLYYHSLFHTLSEVLPAVRYLAENEGLTGETFTTLMVAAHYHDIGFIVKYEDHESASAEIALEFLPKFGFSSEQIQTIRGIILATHLPQTPKTILEKIMADADLDVLGAPNFMARNRDLRRELEAQGNQIDDLRWYRGQVNFIRSHHYWTATARVWRGPQKERNLAELEKLLVETQERV